MIVDKQYNLSLDIAYRNALQNGFLPSPSQVSQDAASRFEGVSCGSPTVQIMHLNRRQRFPRQAFNDFLDQVYFDLRIAYNEFVDLFKRDLDAMVARVNEVSALTLDLGNYEKIADDLKDILTRTNTYTASFGDSFNDTNQVDRSVTDAEIDIDSGIVTLKRSAAGTNRISLKHLWESYVPNMSLMEAPPTSVLRNSPAAGHGFSNALMDGNSSWLQSILLDNYSGPLTADIDIPVVEANSQAVRISKVEIKTHGTTAALVQVFASADGDTFSQFGNPIDTNSRALVFHSPGMDVKVLRIRMRKAGYDSQQGNSFEYLFGADYIRLFRIVYAQSNSFYTQPLVVNGDIKNIQLQTEEDRPDSTDIQYFVKVQGMTSSDWSAITPLNRKGTAPQKIAVSSSNHVDQDMETNAVLPAKTANGIVFHKLGDFPDGIDVDVRTAKIYRGINAWRMRTSRNTVRKTARDVFINFNFQSPDGRQDLYAFRSDDAFVVSTGEVLTDGTQPAASIRTPITIEYNAASMTTIPTGKGDHFDQEPNYSIASIVRSVAGAPIGFSTVQANIEGSRMEFQPNAQDTYLTTAQLKLNSLAVATVAENQVVSPSFVQSDTEEGLKVFSYTDVTNPEILTVFTADSSSVSSFVTQGEFKVAQNNYILYPLGSEFIEYNGHEFLKLNAGRSADVSVDPDMFGASNSSALQALLNQRDTAIYILYASLSSNPVSQQTGSTSDGYLLIPSVAHYEVDPTMFQNLVLPTSVYMKTTDGSVDGNFSVQGVTQASVLKTNSNGATEYVTVDALRISTSGTSARGGSSTIPATGSFNLETWYISYADVTQYVSGIENDTIRFQSGFQLSRDDKIVVTYRAKFGDKLRAIGETIVVTSAPGQGGVKYLPDQDYRVDPGTGTISMVQNGAINRGNAGRAYVSMEYEEDVSDLYVFTTWLHSSLEKPIDLIMAAFGGFLSESEPIRTRQAYDVVLDKNLGEGVTIGGSEIDKGGKVKISKGWYYITIKAKDMFRARSILAAVDDTSAMIFGPNSYFDVMRAYKDPLRYIHPDSFYDSNRLGSHKFFTIDPLYGIIISFNPGDNALLSNRLYDVYKGEVLNGVFEGNLIQRPEDMPVILEKFRIEYNYSPELPGFRADVAIDPSIFASNGFLPATSGRYVINTMLLKAVLSRAPGQTADRTPVLKEYKLLIEA